MPSAFFERVKDGGTPTLKALVSAPARSAKPNLIIREFCAVSTSNLDRSYTAAIFCALASEELTLLQNVRLAARLKGASNRIILSGQRVRGRR